MGEFADVMEGSAEPAAPDPSAPAESSVAPDTGGSPASVPGSAPSTPETPAARAGGMAGAPPQPAQFPKTGDLGQALKESRGELKRLKQTYGWLPAQEASNWRNFFEAHKRDAKEALIGELEVHIPGLRQLLDLATRVSSGDYTAEQDQEPGPDYQLADGTPFMSEKRRAEWQAWYNRQNDRKLEQRLQPIAQYVQQRQLQDVQQGMVQDAQARARALFQKAHTWPYFTDSQAAIKERFEALSAESPHEPAQALFLQAYQDVLHERLRQQGNQHGQAKASALLAKPGATTPNPARPASVSSTKRPADFREAAERLLSVRRG